MRKIFFIAMIAITAGIAAKSQDKKESFNPYIYKGDWLAGGSESWLTSKYKGTSNTKTNTFTLTPEYGYFFTDRLAGGLRVNYSTYNQSNSSSPSYSNFQVAPFLRYYILPADSKTNIFGDISYGFGSEGAATKKSFNYFGVMAGPSFFLNRSTGLEVVGMYKTWGGEAYPQRENEFGVWAGFQPHLRCHQPSAWTPEIGRGDWLAGGDLWYSVSKVSGVSNSNTTYFSASPDLGYFFAPKFAGGLRLNYTSTKAQSSSDAYTNFFAEPFIRYYALPQASKVNIFGDVSYGFGSQGQNTKQSYNYFGVTAGPSFFLSPHTSLDAGIMYRSYGGAAYSTHYNQIGININYQVHLGK